MNPEFNEQFEFYIPMEKLKDYTLEIIVMDKDRIGRNECIGKVNDLLQYFKEIHRFFCTLQCLLSQQRNHQLLKIQSVKLPFSGYIGSQRKFIGKATLERYDLKVRLCFIEYFEFHGEISPIFELLKIICLSPKAPSSQWHVLKLWISILSYFVYFISVYLKSLQTKVS